MASAVFMGGPPVSANATPASLAAAYPSVEGLYVCPCIGAAGHFGRRDQGAGRQSQGSYPASGRLPRNAAVAGSVSNALYIGRHANRACDILAFGRLEAVSGGRAHQTVR